MKYDVLENQIQSELSWRKKEISELFLIAKENDKDVLLKSTILVLYAHWEGFIKKSSKIYLKYIIEKKIKIRALSSNFKAIAIKNSATNCLKGESMTLANEIALMAKISKMDCKQFKININPNDDTN